MFLITFGGLAVLVGALPMPKTGVWQAALILPAGIFLIRVGLAAMKGSRLAVTLQTAVWVAVCLAIAAACATGMAVAILKGRDWSGAWLIVAVAVFGWLAVYLVGCALWFRGNPEAWYLFPQARRVSAPP